MSKKPHIPILIILSAAVALHGMSNQEGTNPPARVESSEMQAAQYDYTYEEHLRIYAQRKYALLLVTLRNRLSESDSAQLESILIERELVVNSRQRPTDKDYLVKSRKKFDLQIRTQFGGDVADAVITHLKNTPTRGFLARVNMLLAYMDEPLGTGQIDRLCLIFAAHPSSPAPRDAKSTAEIETYLEQREARDHMIITEAGGYLSPAQLNVLSEEMKFQLSYTKVGLARAFNK